MLYLLLYAVNQNLINIKQYINFIYFLDIILKLFILLFY